MTYQLTKDGDKLIRELWLEALKVTVERRNKMTRYLLWRAYQ